MMNTITIIADHREAGSACFQWLQACPHVELQVATLPEGDYTVGHCVIERKTLQDLSKSVIDGRLFSQQWRLLTHKRAVLLIEGDSAYLGRHGVSRPALQGALIHLSVIGGIPVVYALNAVEAGQLILYVAQQQHMLRQGRITRHGYILLVLQVAGIMCFSC